MRKQFYGRLRLPSYSAIASTLALVFSLAALCIGGAMATGVIVTSKQIKNGSIRTQDIHKNAVRTSDIGTSAVMSTDIGTGAVQTSDIGAGQVAPEDVTMPAPAQISETSVETVQAPDGFVVVDVAGSYAKADPSSLLEVSWTGTVATGFSPCIFQLRVDGQPSGANAGEIYVANSSTLSVSVSALFSGLPVGPHQVEVWAKSSLEGSYPCTVGPASAGIGQTFVIAEQVV